jgi:hypothetical protein
MKGVEPRGGLVDFERLAKAMEHVIGSGCVLDNFESRSSNSTTLTISRRSIA